MRNTTTACPKQRRARSARLLQTAASGNRTRSRQLSLPISRTLPFGVPQAAQCGPAVARQNWMFVILNAGRPGRVARLERALPLITDPCQIKA
jgi:hypothetical protein